MIESFPVTPRSTQLPDPDNPEQMRRVRAAAEAVVGDDIARRAMRRTRARFIRRAI